MTTASESGVAEELLREALFHRSYNQVPFGLIIDC